MPINNKTNTTLIEKIKQLVLLFSKSVFICVVIFTAINVDYHYNHRNYSPFKEKDYPQVSKVGEDSDYNYYKVVPTCASKKFMAVDIKQFIEKSIITVNSDNEEFRYGSQYPRIIEFKAKKNIKISFASTCDIYLLPIQSNYIHL